MKKSKNLIGNIIAQLFILLIFQFSPEGRLPKGMLSVFGAGNNFGAGVIIGEPTGISLKYWLSGDSAVDFALAWSFSGNDSLHLHSDYLLHNFDLFNINKGKLPLYYGIGGRFRIKEEEKNKGKRDKKNIFGIRIPVGCAYIFDNIPIDIFLEVVPVVNLFPDTNFDLDIATGARYFF